MTAAIVNGEETFHPGTLRWVDSGGVTHHVHPHAPSYSTAQYIATDYWDGDATEGCWRVIRTGEPCP